MPVSVEKMNSPDVHRQDCNKEGITSRLLAKVLKAELFKKKTITTKLKGAVNKKNLPKWCKVITTSGLITYDKKGGVHYGDGETLLAMDVDALDIQQNARRDAQKGLGLTVDKLEVAGPDGGPIEVLNVNTLTEETKAIAKQIAKEYARTRKHKSISPTGS